MKLYFEVVSKDRYYLGDAAQFVFDEQGGRIGRSERCEWVLEDCNNYISSIHLDVRFHASAFYVTDLSTNGTLRGHRRLAPQQQDPAPLKIGDELQLGHVKIRVTEIEVDLTPEVTRVVLPQPESTHSQILQNSQYEDVDELEVLAQQAKLADVISQCYPDLDHGVVAAELSRGSISESTELPTASHVHQGPLDAHLDPELLLEIVVKALFVEVQQRLAVDRIENPSVYASIASKNVFRKAASLTEFYELVNTAEELHADVKEVLVYLVSSGSGGR